MDDSLKNKFEGLEDNETPPENIKGNVEDTLSIIRLMGDIAQVYSADLGKAVLGMAEMPGKKD